MEYYLTSHIQSQMVKETEKGKLQNIPPNKPASASPLYESAMSRQEGHAIALGSFPAPAPASELAGLRVLIAEDNEINQQLARASLHRVGVITRIAADGIETLQILAQETFDVVLMDMNMPNVDGIEATRLIRKNPALAELTIIAMTANSMFGDRERCLAAGMDDYISKPIEFEQMYAILGRWSRRKAKPSQPASIRQETQPGFAVLDAARAIVRMGGEEKIYLAVLERFIVSQGATVKAVRDALAANEQKTAARLAHSLKGIAATVGAGAMSRIVRNLEQAIHQGDQPQCKQLLSNAETEMSRVIAAANEYLMAHKSTIHHAYSAHDSIGMENLLEQLDKQLHTFDSRANATMRELKQLIENTGYRERFVLLERYINAYDYANALLELSRVNKEE